jgi:membrane-associated phospholipid phosphatase
MISRLYLGAHFATDVIGGAVAASAFLIVFTHFIKRKN